MQQTREQTSAYFSPQNVFPKAPTIHLEPEESACSCGSKLNVMKSKTRKVCTLHIGPFYVHETVKECCDVDCKQIYRCSKLDHLVPPGTLFGYDIIEFIGHSVWFELRTIQQIKDDFERKNIIISKREIGHLAKKYVCYVVEAHEDKRVEIRNFLHSGGGWFLYFDSMHPGDGAAHLMCAIAEEISKNVSIVLGSIKLPKESTETVADFLRELREKYGIPLAGICDMLASNLAAFKEVFPDVLLLICHFHFLRGLGKKFLKYEKTRLDGFLEQYDVNSAWTRKRKMTSKGFLSIFFPKNVNEDFKSFSLNQSLKPIFFNFSRIFVNISIVFS